MTQADFDFWVEILREYFPEHPLLAQLGTTFVPRLPDDATALTSGARAINWRKWYVAGAVALVTGLVLELLGVVFSGLIRAVFSHL
jgi:hypothetical protein